LHRGLAHRLRRRLTFANVVALLALFIALGGTSIGEPVRHAGAHMAASLKSVLKLSRKADHNARLALKTARRADKNAKAALAKAAVPGPPGAPGAAGAAGAPGAATAYATVEYCVTSCEDQPNPGWFTPDEESSGIDNTVNFSHPAPGVFCFSNTVAELHNAVVSMAPSPRSYVLQARAGTADDPISSSLCPAVAGGPDHNAVLEVRDPADPTQLIDPNTADTFFVVFN
jgi:hypothetical protein